MRFNTGVGATDSMPERLQVTKEIELRKQQQAVADQVAAAQKQSQPTAVPSR